MTQSNESKSQFNQIVVKKNLEERYSKFYQQLKRLEELKSKWDGYSAEKPNNLAISKARNILNTLRELDISPRAILPSAEGGVAICFTEGNRYADIECFNDGDILIGLSDPQSSPKVYETSMDNINKEILNIHGYLEARNPRTNVDGRKIA